MQVGAALVTHCKALEAVQPCEGAFDHPAVPSKRLAARDAAPCDSGLDAAGTALAAAPARVITFVSVELVQTPPWPSTMPGLHARHCVQRRGRHYAVVTVDTTQRDAERRAPGVGDNVAFCAWPAAVRRDGPNL